jgi:hypothetical protein
MPALDLYHNTVKKSLLNDRRRKSQADCIRSKSRGDRKMDTLANFRTTIKIVLEPYTKIPYSHGDLICKAVICV